MNIFSLDKHKHDGEVDRRRIHLENRIHIPGTQRLNLERGIICKSKLHNSFNFFDLIQCIVVRRYICIVNLVESNHNWVPTLGILQDFKQNVLETHLK